MTIMQKHAAGIRLTMLSEEFRAWRSLMGWSMREAGEHLGINRNTVLDYEHRGAPERIRQACRALAIAHKKVEVAVVYPWERAA
jgi:transcriptional regulator with XRE-family HTH domain